MKIQKSTQELNFRSEIRKSDFILKIRCESGSRIVFSNIDTKIKASLQIRKSNFALKVSLRDPEVEFCSQSFVANPKVEFCSQSFVANPEVEFCSQKSTQKLKLRCESGSRILF